MASRSELRYTRYHQLRDLGFSSAEASRLRDRDADTIDAAIASRQRQISKKRQSSRTESEREQLQQIREYRQAERRNPTVTREPLESDLTRQQNFNRWTGERHFPPAILRYISGLNQMAGLGPLDSYGFRVFYWQYVRGYTEKQAKMQVRTLDRERRDT